MTVEPDGNILVSDFLAGIIRIDPATGNQMLFSTTPQVTDLVVDGGTIWAVQRGSLNILQIDRHTAAESVLPVDLSLIPDLCSIEQEDLKIDLAANGDLLIARIEDRPISTYSAIRINKATGVASPVVDGTLLQERFVGAVASEAKGDILLAGQLFTDPSTGLPAIGVIRVNPTTGDFDFVTSGGILDFPEEILVAPRVLR